MLTKHCLGYRRRKWRRRREKRRRRGRRKRIRKKSYQFYYNTWRIYITSSEGLGNFKQILHLLNQFDLNFDNTSPTKFWWKRSNGGLFWRPYERHYSRTDRPSEKAIKQTSSNPGFDKSSHVTHCYLCRGGVIPLLGIWSTR